MPTRRYHHLCGAVDRGDKGIDIVVAGGYRSDWAVEDMDWVEIFNLKTMTWRVASEYNWKIK